MSNINKSKLIKVKGRVQGVGFRPFIYRIALDNNINGNVINNTDGVEIIAQSDSENINNFISDISSKAPRASQIDTIDCFDIKSTDFNDFRIEKSKEVGSSNEITEVSPDISVCEDCMNDIKKQTNRINYAFTNCTDCGPRFTIIKDLPYDRKQTTMKDFVMCDSCFKEYTDVGDRRFHAQPVACNDCGPHYQAEINGKTISDFDEILQLIFDTVSSGKILALKGLGGYHLICDAFNNKTVAKLRHLKHREAKPLAVMFKDISSAKKYCHINKYESEILNSWQKPILLLKEKQNLATEVCKGFNRIGSILPYMPIHYMIFGKLNIDALVFTSGNISDEPVIIKDSEAKSELAGVYDEIVFYNREIHNRVDDSVVQSIDNKINILRRARGFVPSPVRTKLNTNNILACGAELVNTFAIGRGNNAILSQHIGDLKNIETLEFYEESINRFARMFQLKPELIVHDKHPEYLSSKYAVEQNIKTISVQHHHAHIASAMLENGIDEKVIGFSFDGTGLGDDGNIWGGEVFICDLADFERVNHFKYIPIPGGDKATKQNWRTALSYLYDIYGQDIFDLNIDFLNNLDRKNAEIIIQMIDKQINSPLSSSCGRLFDAVSAITNICTDAKFHAEAPMRFENIIQQNIHESYNYEIENEICFDKTIQEIIKDLQSKIDVGIISAKFHNTIIDLILKQSIILREYYNLNKVIISGGSFQNVYLSENTIKKLRQNKFEVFSHHEIPANDGGISLGQLAIAAKRRELKLI